MNERVVGQPFSEQTNDSHKWGSIKIKVEKTYVSKQQSYIYPLFLLLYCFEKNLQSKIPSIVGHGLQNRFPWQILPAHNNPQLWLIFLVRCYYDKGKHSYSYSLLTLTHHMMNVILFYKFQLLVKSFLSKNFLHLIPSST